MVRSSMHRGWSDRLMISSGESGSHIQVSGESGSHNYPGPFCNMGMRLGLCVCT